MSSYSQELNNHTYVNMENGVPAWPPGLQHIPEMPLRQYSVRAQYNASSHFNGEDNRKDGLDTSQKLPISKLEEYKKKASLLKQELDTLKIQRNELRGDGQRSPSPDTKKFLKENTKLQLEIQNKIKTIYNVLDVLSDIVVNNPECNVPNEWQIKPKCSQKFNYIFYDPEMHWCRACNEFPLTAQDYLDHLHSTHHQKMAAEHKEAPWHNLTGLNESYPTLPNAPTKRTPIRGLQFFVPATAWYCKLCDQFVGDLHCASDHTKSIVHTKNYNEFVQQNPDWETDWMSDRQKALLQMQVEAKYEEIEKSETRSDKYISETVTVSKYLHIKRPTKSLPLELDGKKRYSQKPKDKDKSSTSRSRSSYEDDSDVDLIDDTTQKQKIMTSMNMSESIDLDDSDDKKGIDIIKKRKCEDLARSPENYEHSRHSIRPEKNWRASSRDRDFRLRDRSRSRERRGSSRNRFDKSRDSFGRSRDRRRSSRDRRGSSRDRRGSKRGTSRDKRKDRRDSSRDRQGSSQDKQESQDRPDDGSDQPMDIEEPESKEPNVSTELAPSGVFVSLPLPSLAPLPIPTKAMPQPAPQEQPPLLQQPTLQQQPILPAAVAVPPPLMVPPSSFLPPVTLPNVPKEFKEALEMMFPTDLAKCTEMLNAIQEQSNRASLLGPVPGLPLQIPFGMMPSGIPFPFDYAAQTSQDQFPPSIVPSMRSLQGVRSSRINMSQNRRKPRTHASSNNNKKSIDKDNAKRELDELAMLGIDASDVGAGI